jgi:LacI family transcriptional regulator
MLAMTRTPHVPGNPQVTVIVPASTGWGRGIIKGVAAFANHHGPWCLQIHAEGGEWPLPRDWRADGIVARLSTPAMARAAVATGVPVVNVSGIRLEADGEKVPRVCSDLRGSGSLAARHLLDRGFKHFGYVGLPKLAYVREHQEAYAATLAKEGHACQAHALGPGVVPAGGASRLLEWLISLPKPVGVLTWSNAQGRAVIDACRRAALLVPEQVAVLSGDDDPLLCESCLPQLSAIAAAAEQIGEQAAGLLQRLINRERPPRSPILVPPVGIVTRQSTNTLALEDPDLVAAVVYIREHATKGINVNDVLQIVPMSRRQLERSFRDRLSRSPAEEIRRVRLEQVKHLLATTDLPIPKVASACGFCGGEYLAAIFRQATGITPLQFRTASRRR